MRQAKHTFGNTLPKDYLSAEEYKVYERLYGAPLRTTLPEDVGMHVDGEMPVEDYYEDPSRRVLLRDTVDGDIEEVAYYAEQTSTGPEDPEAEIPESASDNALESVPDSVPESVPESAPEGASESAPDSALESASEGELVSVSDSVSESALDSAPTDVVDEANELPSEAGLNYVNAVAKSKREYYALLKLQKDFEIANAKAIEEENAAYVRPEPEEEFWDEEPEEQIEQDEEQEEEQEDEGEPDATFNPARVHGYTELGRWRTFPGTVQIPKASFVTPITELLRRTDVKHVRAAAEKAFGGPTLPDSVATPPLKKNRPQRGVAMEAGHHKMNDIEADAYMATNMPGLYASVRSILIEVRKRLGTKWMHDLMERNNGEGPRVLDVGAGGAGLAAWEEILQAEWDLAVDEGKKKGLIPPGKKTVVVGSETLRHRVSRFLHNTTFLPRLPDYLHSGNPKNLEAGELSQSRKQFDIIIASHIMMPVKEGWRRNEVVDNLWELLSPEGGILIIMEKGHPRGFEAVADIRSRLLNEFIIAPASDPHPDPNYRFERVEPENRRVREQGSIIAPCTNHKACPMYLTPGLSLGRKDFCHFSQRYIRPPFLQRVLGAKHHNHEDIAFSFLAVQRGSTAEPSAGLTYSAQTAAARAFEGYEGADPAPDPRALPRNIMRPLKRHGHVTMDLCTPAGTIERWTVPKSFSQQAYHDARKVRWGDLWALGAKSRVVRQVRLGKGGTAGKDGEQKPRVISLNADAGGIYSATERGRSPRRGGRPVERRTKGGKKAKPRNLLEELQREEL